MGLGGPQSWYGHLGKKKILFPFLGILPWIVNPLAWLLHHLCFPSPDTTASYFCNKKHAIGYNIHPVLNVGPAEQRRYSNCQRLSHDINHGFAVAKR
jgi:hypothetical protein